MLHTRSIGAGLLSQFGPGKFPGNWWMVFGCVVAYLVLTTALNLYSWKVEGEAFLVTRPFRVRRAGGRAGGGTGRVGRGGGGWAGPWSVALGLWERVW